MKWLLAGASGFLGTALRVRLATEGHEVVRLVRREPATATEFRWDPDAGQLDRAAFDGVDVVVNLAGTGVFDKLWTTRNRERIVSSRANTTGTLARTLVDLAGTGSAPALIQASGVAHYGTARTEQPHTEDSPAANDFLAQVTVVGWERPDRGGGRGRGPGGADPHQPGAGPQRRTISADEARLVARRGGEAG